MKSMALRIAFIVPLCASIGNMARSETLLVPRDYPTIQRAIDAANPRDIVLVSPGTYTENIEFKGKLITVQSAHGALATIIDGNQKGSVVRFQEKEGPGTVLQGFTITNGTGTPVQNVRFGGGILCTGGASPTIRQNIITDNTTERGGGIACHQGHQVIEDCIIEKNRECGIYLMESKALISDCIIRLNASDYFGGGIWLFTNCHPTIRNNLIVANRSAGQGGGICSWGGTFPVIRDNTIACNQSHTGAGIYIRDGQVRSNAIVHNTARAEGIGRPLGFGGGIACTAGDPTMIDNTIAFNKAFSQGGGMLCGGSGTYHNNTICFNAAGGGIAPPYTPRGGGGLYFLISGTLPPLLSNCLIYGNNGEEAGGGACMGYESKALIWNCLFIENTAPSGGGIHCDDSNAHHLKVMNSILWENGQEEIHHETRIPDVTYSDVKGGFPGTGNIDADPCFVDSANWDFHLLYTSPCRDAGYGLPDGPPAEDFEGDPRCANGIPDMGPDEFYTHLYCKGKATPGGGVNVRLLDDPGTAPVILWAGAAVLDPPHLTSHGEWYLRPPLYMEVPLALDPVEGLAELPCRIPSNIMEPWDLPIQALSGERLTNLFILEVR